ncbi:MAG: FAD-dependent oxidoreductase [Parvularcula sp.]|jgi:glycine oxidase|nr:FAD-dependent oxidoreductase [Parvularcula sp.]
MAFEVAIIGDGVIGAAAAFHLADRGRDVVLIGDGKGGATLAAGGMLSPSFEGAHDAADGEVARLMAAGLAAWDGFARRLSDDPYSDFGYRRDGVYGIGFHARPQGAAIKPGPHALPAFARKPSAFAPEEGGVDPVRLRPFMIAAAVRRGASHLMARAKLQGDTLYADGEVVSAERWVVATGADKAMGPAELLGVKGAAALYRLSEEDRDAVPFIVRSPTVYFVPRQGRDLYVGATEEWAGSFSATIEDVERDAARLLPALQRAERLARFEGFRPFIDRRGPLIARDERFGHIVRAQGHHRNGVLLAPLTAQRIEGLLDAC